MFLSNYYLRTKREAFEEVQHLSRLSVGVKSRICQTTLKKFAAHVVAMASRLLLQSQRDFEKSQQLVKQT